MTAPKDRAFDQVLGEGAEEIRALRQCIADVEAANAELREWRDQAVASCAKRRCSERERELMEARQLLADVEGRSEGVERIAAERQRQIDAEGWTPEHDDEHDCGEMVSAAACYAGMAQALVNGSSIVHPEVLSLWPWDFDWWKPSDDPVRNLEKAGALIAAEIDRLLREPRAQTERDPEGR